MIPQFPQFKHVEVEDREAVEAHTHRYEPYSDFNFTSLWAWDTSNERMISELGGNLVVRFTDYSTHEPFLSFLGTSEPEKTARTLIEYSAAEGLPAILRLVPEISVAGMRPSVLAAEEDRDNHDYVYSVPALATYRGNKYDSKRNLANRFRREHPDMRVEIVGLSDARVKRDVLYTIEQWEKNKISSGKGYEVEHERAAIHRLFETAVAHTLMVIGLFIVNEMKGFSILESLPNGWTIEHFWKTDVGLKGSFEILMQEQAMHLETLGCSNFNFEQDLGIESLRRSKEAFRPVQFIKKYVVSYL